MNKLIERLEATFIKHFANGNRRKGMKSLKPGQKREKHRTTFFVGKACVHKNMSFFQHVEIDEHYHSHMGITILHLYLIALRL